MDEAPFRSDISGNTDGIQRQGAKGFRARQKSGGRKLHLTGAGNDLIADPNGRIANPLVLFANKAFGFRDTVPVFPNPISVKANTTMLLANMATLFIHTTIRFPNTVSGLANPIFLIANKMTVLANTGAVLINTELGILVFGIKSVLFREN
jgi:hypothetical protein